MRAESQPTQRDKSVAKAKGRWGQRPKDDRHDEGTEAIHTSKMLLRQRKIKKQQDHNVDFSQDSWRTLRGEAIQKAVSKTLQGSCTRLSEARS